MPFFGKKISSYGIALSLAVLTLVVLASFPSAASAGGPQSVTGSRTAMSQEQANILAEQINLLFLDARKAKENCDRERYAWLVSQLAEKLRKATASMEAHAELIQQMSLRLTEITEDYKRHLPSGVGGQEVASLAASEAISITLSVAEATPIIGHAINAVKTLNSLAEKDAAMRDVADIGNRLQEQYRQILEVLISFHRWKTLADEVTNHLESLATLEFNCPREGDTSDEGSSASEWQEVAKGDLIDDETGQALEGGSISVDPVDDDTATTPEDRVLKPGDRIIITAPCHEKLVYVVGLDKVPDKIKLKHKPVKIAMDCSLGEKEIKERAIKYFKKQGIDATEDKLDIKNIGKFDGVDKCEVTIKNYGLAKNQSCSGLPPTDTAGSPDDSAGPGDESGTPKDGSKGPDDGIDTNEPREGQVVSDPYYSSSGSWGQSYDDQWALKAIGFVDDKDGKNLWPEVATPVTVALIDTGLDMYHPDMLGAIWINEGEIPGNGKDDDGNGYIDDVNGWNFVDDNADISDNNGHGTFVAGIIAAWGDNGVGIAGVNPWARIMPVKATDFNNKGGSINIAKAIRYATDNGARVINISIGGEGYSAIEEAAIKDAVSKGVVVVVAAGNKGINTNEFFPAGLPEVITVASTDMNGKRVGFSNWGGQVDIAAPGVDVLSVRAKGTDFIVYEKKDYKKGLAIVGKDKRYYRTSGSSFSAPFVSGVASLILSIHPDLTGEQVRRMLLYSADDIEVPGRDQYTGHGLLNARAALAADPDFFLDAAVKTVKAAKTKQGTMIQVVGSVDANKLKSAWVEIGAGDNPTEWEAVSKPIKKAVKNGVVGEFPSSALSGSKKWVIKVVAEHKNGRKTEARYNLTLK